MMKAVIPVAGLGTRMLPATKSIPKEMLPIVDRPLIQYIVEECAQAGVEEIILVTHSSKNSIADHFDTSFELENMLEQRIKNKLLKEVRSICPENVKIIQIRQGQALGLGHAICCAHPVIGDNPFIVLLPDVLLNSHYCDPCHDNLSAMIKRFQKQSVAKLWLNLSHSLKYINMELLIAKVFFVHKVTGRLFVVLWKNLIQNKHLLIFLWWGAMFSLQKSGRYSMGCLRVLVAKSN